MLLVLGFAFACFGATVLGHYEALRLLTRGLDRLRRSSHRRLLLVMCGLVVAHLLEIAVYALAFWSGVRLLSVGGFVGAVAHGGLSAFDAFCFSAEAYTSLGMGDLYPVGPLRLLAGLETLNGLLLIGWSTSFTYLAMESYWTLRPLDCEEGPPRADPAAPRSAREPSTRSAETKVR